MCLGEKEKNRMPGRGMRAGWQEGRKTLASLQRTAATALGSRWQCWQPAELALMRYSLAA
jgi:hypothetical protein